MNTWLPGLLVALISAIVSVFAVRQTRGVEVAKVQVEEAKSRQTEIWNYVTSLERRVQTLETAVDRKDAIIATKDELISQLRGKIHDLTFQLIEMGGDPRKGTTP